MLKTFCAGVVENGVERVEQVESVEKRVDIVEMKKGAVMFRAFPELFHVEHFGIYYCSLLTGIVPVTVAVALLVVVIGSSVIAPTAVRNPPLMRTASVWYRLGFSACGNDAPTTTAAAVVRAGAVYMPAAYPDDCPVYA